MANTSNLSLPFIEAAQAQKHVTHNEALRILDSIVQLAVVAVTNSPPGSPAEGERHIVGGSPTGAFAAHATEIAVRQDGGWVFIVPQTGWRAWDIDAEALRIWTGSAWTSLEGGGGGALDDLSDVAITIPEDGDVLTYHQGSGMWVNDGPQAGGGGASELDDLDDVAITDPQNGDGLFYNSVSGLFENGPPGGGPAAVQGDGITHIVALSQAAYDALVPPDGETLYIIVET